MIVVQTPLRISLFGGGTDFPDYFRQHGGCVLSTTIDKYIFVTIMHRFDEKIVVGYTRTESVDSVRDIKHDLIREALDITKTCRGVEIATMADIPSTGSGLGSSSSITVGALHAAYALQGELVSAETLAQQACHIERDILKQPIGIQDQYIAAYGNLRFIEFCKNGETRVHKTQFSPMVRQKLQQNLLLFYTGISRQSGAVLSEQKANIADKQATLGKMQQIARDAVSALQHEDVDAVGDLLHESWQLKKQLASRISNPEINDMYDAAREAGAIGGKISGAGGGGFLMLYCPVEHRSAVIQRLSHLRELPFRFDSMGSQIIFNKQRT